MNGILLSVILVSGIGIVAGALLAILSKVMAVPVDEKAAAIEEILPGANCGSCGFSGCAGYAAALSQGTTTQTGLCNPGGNEVSGKIAEIMGLKAESVEPMCAVVMCRGINGLAEKKMEYSGVPSCKMAVQLFGGDKACSYGCLGLGDCARACPYDAIMLCDGVAVVSPDVCRACKKCMSVCPKGIIELLPKARLNSAVLCKNHDKGAQTRKDCKTGCIGCMKCVKACPNEAIHIENNAAVVDNEKCTACGACCAACPTGAIKIF